MERGRGEGGRTVAGQVNNHAECRVGLHTHTHAHTHVHTWGRDALRLINLHTHTVQKVLGWLYMLTHTLTTLDKHYRLGRWCLWWLCLNAYACSQEALTRIESEGHAAEHGATAGAR